MRWLMVVCLLGVMLAACGDSEHNDQGATRASSTPPPAGAAAPVQPKGELRIGVTYLTGTLDPTGKLGEGYSLVRMGMGETLTRVNRENKLEPWLAERVEPVDATTWRVTLRKNATFHDGSPVTADAVSGSFRRSWELQPSANGFISRDTQITATDATTLLFKTPKPLPNLPNLLANYQFLVHKPVAGGFAMTGPYRPVQLEVDNRLTLEAHAAHWAGPPPIAKIQVKRVPDVNTLALALQSGDVDLVADLPPDILGSLPSSIERVTAPSLRVFYAVLNHGREPFSDRRVREALAAGVDRAVLNKAVFDGLGTPVSTVFPANAGVDVVAAQSTDTTRARQLLDEAGWKAGGDGIRQKDGRQLTIAMYSYGGRAADKALAVALQAQMKALGVEASYQERQDLFTAVLTGSEWDVAVTSFGVLPTGDPLYIFNETLVNGAPYNWGKYNSPQMDTAIELLRTEADPAARQALSRRAQELIKVDAPNAYLLASPLVFAYRKDKVQGFQPSANDLYFIDTTVSVK